MMSIGILCEAIMMKCETRAQQVGLVIGMAVIVAGMGSVGMWLFEMGEAARETVIQAAEMNMRSGRRFNQVVIYFYGGAAICGVVSVIFSLVGIINLVRFLTHTGLAEKKSW
jgi:hypothetical protein